MPYDESGEWLPIPGAMPAAGGFARGVNSQKGRADWAMLRSAIEAEMRRVLTDDDIRKNLGYPSSWRVTENCRVLACRSIAERALRALVSGMADALTQEGALKIAGFCSFKLDINYRKIGGLLRTPEQWFFYNRKKDVVKTAKQSVEEVFNVTAVNGEHVLDEMPAGKTHFVNSSGVAVPYERDIVVRVVNSSRVWSAFRCGIKARITTNYADATIQNDIDLIAFAVVVRCRIRDKGNGDWQLIGTVPAGQRALFDGLWAERHSSVMSKISDWPMLSGDAMGPGPAAGRSVKELIDKGYPVTLDEAEEFNEITAMRVRNSRWVNADEYSPETKEGNIAYQRRWNIFEGYPLAVVEEKLIREFEYVKLTSYKDSNGDGKDDGDGYPYYCRYVVDAYGQEMREEGYMFPPLVMSRPDDPPNPPDTAGTRKTNPRVRARFSAAVKNEIAAS